MNFPRLKVSKRPAEGAWLSRLTRVLLKLLEGFREASDSVGNLLQRQHASQLDQPIFGTMNPCTISHFHGFGQGVVNGFLCGHKKGVLRPVGVRGAARGF